MNAYFKSAVERYKKLLKNKESFLINPLSEVDCEIIIELKELLIKAGNNQAINILKEYKGQVKDTEIRDQLIQCNIDTKNKELEFFDEYGDDEEVDVKELKKRIKALQKALEDNKREFIVIQEDRIFAYLIFGYEKIDKSTFDYEEFQLVLNPTRIDATKIPLYANKTFTFYDKEKCDQTVELLDEVLQKTKVKIIKNGD
jgi:hypothetical protein